MENIVPVKLFDPKQNFLYTIRLKKQDAQYLQTEKNFTPLLQNSRDYNTNENVNKVPDVQSEVENEKCSWAYNEILALINAYDSYKENFKVVKKRMSVWQDISNELVSNGFEKSAMQCELKWRNLIRTDKNVKDMKNKTGRGPSRFQFFNLIDDIMGDKPAINCSHTFSSTVPPTINETKDISTELINKKETDGTLFSTLTEISTTSKYNSCESTPRSLNKKRKRLNEDVLKKKNEDLIDAKLKYIKQKQEEIAVREKRREKNGIKRENVVY